MIKYNNQWSEVHEGLYSNGKFSIIYGKFRGTKELGLCWGIWEDRDTGEISPFVVPREFHSAIFCSILSNSNNDPKIAEKVKEAMDFLAS